MFNSCYGISETPPHLVLTVLRHLVRTVGVAQKNIEKVLRAETSGNRIAATESWFPAGPQGHAGVVTIKKGPEFRAFLVCQSQQREQKRPRAPVDSFLGKFGDEGLD